jgi:hypothetical protein
MLVSETWHYIQYSAWGAISMSVGFPMNSGSNENLLITGLMRTIV